MTIFGRIVTGSDVEHWCIDLCRRWCSTYMSEVERQHGLAARHYQRPRAYIRSLSFDKFPEDQLPAVGVVSYGIVTPPRREGSGAYTAQWLIGLGVLCSARTQEGSRDYAALLAAALGALFVQRPSLDGHAQGVDWLDSTLNDLSFDDTRSLSSVQSRFAIEVAEVVNSLAGPTTPDAEPDDGDWGEWPVVLTHEEIVENEPVNVPLVGGREAS